MVKDDTLLIIGALGIAGAILYFGSPIKDTLGGVGSGLSEGIGGIGSGVSTGFQGLGSGISQTAGGIGTAVQGLGGGIGAIGESAGSGISRIVDSAGEAGGSLFDIFNAGFDFVGSGITGAQNKLTSLLGGSKSSGGGQPAKPKTLTLSNPTQAKTIYQQALNTPVSVPSSNKLLALQPNAPLNIKISSSSGSNEPKKEVKSSSTKKKVCRNVTRINSKTGEKYTYRKCTLE